MKQKKNAIISLTVALLVPVSVGLLGSIATGESVSTWYQTLKKPAWNPPSWVFGPVWTLLYALMGAASWLIWRKRVEEKKEVRTALTWYGVQLGLNGLWSFIFFGARRPDLALIEIVVLWFAILITVVKFSRLDRLAMALLIPYHLWVTFATALNATIWWLNRGQ